MKKVRRAHLGWHVLATTWVDKDPRDPWYVGLITEFGEDERGKFYKVSNYWRKYRHVWIVSEAEAAAWLALYK